MPYTVRRLREFSLEWRFQSDLFWGWPAHGLQKDMDIHPAMRPGISTQNKTGCYKPIPESFVPFSRNSRINNRICQRIHWNALSTKSISPFHRLTCYLNSNN